MSQKIAALAARVNEKATTDAARWTYEGSVPFVDLGTASLGGEIPHVHRFRLGNGLRLLVLVDRSAPVMSYFTWFRVGSRHEKPGKTGLAHLFEHLMFNESEGLKAGEFDRKLEENGAESNAGTWLDWTYYYESLPKDRFGLAVKLESNRMAKLVLREPQIVSEKEVVANERRMRVDDDVEGTANEILYKTAFTKHPYHWPTIGWMADIEGFDTEDCVAFYKTYYAPNNATIVIAGDVREQDVLDLTGEHVLPADDHHVVVAAEHGQPAAFVEAAQVTGRHQVAQPVLVAAIGVAAEREMAADEDPTRDAGRAVVAGLIDDPQRHAEWGVSGAARVVGEVLGRRHRRVRHLGGAVQVVQHRAERVARTLHEVTRQAAAAGGDDPQRGHVEARRVGVQQLVEQHRDHDQGGRVVLLHRRKHGLGIEGAVQHDRRPQHHGQVQVAQAPCVEHRAGDHRGLTRPQREQ